MSDFTMWWPHPSAFDDLTVEETETGFDLYAPDGTEMAEWLQFWAQTEEHRKFFKDQFVENLTNYANSVLNDGQTEAITDEQSDDRVQAEKDTAGTVA